MKKRTLIHLPIIHTTQDMGNLGDSIHQAAASAFGSRSTIRKDRFVDKIWTAVERTVDSMDLSSHKVRLYQDGLPICGREMEIVADLAEAGSRNHRLLMRMIHSGAVLMGTESPELLLEEYHLIKQAVSGWNTAKGAKGSLERPKMAERLLKRRDQFIAQRIDDTLEPGETGVLFLGMLHALDEYMNPNIRVVRPLAVFLNAQRNK
jgi:hypothetical protein